MSTVTLNPDGNTTPTNTGTLTGSTVYGAWSDASDSTYVTFDAGEAAYVTLDDSSIPSTALIQQISLYIRCRRTNPGSTSWVAALLETGTDSKGEVPSITSTSAIDLVANTWDVSGLGLADSDIDALKVGLGCYGGAPLVVYEAYVVVTYAEVPTLTVDAPTGTVTTTNVPTVEFTPTYGGTPTTVDLEVKVFTDAVYSGGGFDPDTSSAALSWSDTGLSTATVSHAFTEPLADGDYWAAVKVTYNYGGGNMLASAWTYNAFTIDVDLPADPTLTLTPDDELARIAVDVTGNSGTVTTDYFQIERSDDGGSTFTEVRTPQETGVPDGMVSAGIYDYEAPSSTTVTYRARAVHDFGGTYSYSDWVEASDDWTSNDWWIKHPTLPSLNASLKMRSKPGSSRAAIQGEFTTLAADDGQTHTIVVSGGRGPRKGTDVVMAQNAAERAQLDALLDAGVPLLVQGPPSNYEPDRWVVFGDVDRQRLIDKGWSEPTDETLPWTEVDRPSNQSLAASDLTLLLIP